MKQLTRLTETVVTDRGEYQVLTKDAKILLQTARCEQIEAEKKLEIEKAQGCVSAETEEKVKAAKKKIDSLNEQINEEIFANIFEGLGTEPAEEDIQQLISVVSKAPAQWIMPLDKVSNKAFNGEIKAGHTAQVSTAHGKNKEIFAMINIDFSDPQITITGKKELTPYDREVHDAIVTLYVSGGNEYITPQMIYRAMTGKSNAKLNPKQQEFISESLTKLMYSRLVIDASAEAAAYGFNDFKYEGTVIAAEKVTATCKGEVGEWLHLLKAPVLYTYASLKNQIGRIDIKLLNSPINKNEETITLQGYLYRRILAMKSNDKLSKTILYESIYKAIGIETSTSVQIRKKKYRIRENTKKILGFWKEQGFVKNFQENARGTAIISIGIQL